MNDEQLADWLVVCAVSGLGPVQIQQFLQNMSLAELRQALTTSFKHIPESSRPKRRFKLNPQRVDQALTWLEADDSHHILTFDDPFYPPLLKEIDSAPFLLFVKGNVASLSIPSIAIVGSRDATPTGLKHSYEFAQQLVERGIVVSSGLAAGVDGAAHSGALAASNDQECKTTAVLGTGVDVVYPKRHQKLYHDIQLQGCVVSEFWPDTQPYAGNFPKRNRIISGLSLGTVVIEASRRSGSLITARLANEQGREVFALPGSVLSHQSQGCHDLIKSGAKLVDCVDDVLEELPSIYQFHLEEIKSRHNICQEVDLDLPFPKLLASVGYEATAIDAIVEHSGATIDQVLEQLLELELQGWISAVPGGYVKLKRS